jgi:hypothetical protein
LANDLKKKAQDAVAQSIADASVKEKKKKKTYEEEEAEDENADNSDDQEKGEKEEKESDDETPAKKKLALQEVSLSPLNIPLSIYCWINFLLCHLYYS